MTVDTTEMIKPVPRTDERTASVSTEPVSPAKGAEPKEPFERLTASVQGLSIDVIGWDAALERIAHWADQRQSRVVAICNAHSVITARQDPEFREAVENAAMATADGAPVAWTIRNLGYPEQKRINGPDLMLRYCELAAQNGQKIFLYGNEEKTVSRLTKTLLKAFPGLQIAGSITPPFRTLSDAEDEQIVNEINDSGAQVVFVSLGCPKQEKWMADHAGRVQAVMIGVGAAFDYHAGTIKRAPVWMQQRGLEWFYRLVSEPRRLWRRYFLTNTAFVIGAARQFVGTRHAKRR